MKFYYVESYGSWFIVKTNRKTKAKSAGVKDFGRGNVKSVRLATDDEVNYFKSVKGENAIEEIE